MRALILPAGLGERLRPLTLKRAKPAIEFLNIPMLGFPYYWLNTLNLKEVVFNTHYLPESVRHAAMHVVDPAIPTLFTHEEHILGSGGGMWNARAFLDREEHFAVANGDGVVLFEEHDTLERMFKFHVEKGALATFLVCPLEGVGTRLPGVWLDKYGEVSNFGKTQKHGYTECLHYASYAFFSKRIWQYLPEGSSNIIYDVVEPKISDGEKVYGYRVDNMRWFETGNTPEYLAATRECLEYLRSANAYGKCLEQVLNKLCPGYHERSNFKDMQLIADSARLDHALVEGYAVLGDNCTLAQGALLKDSVILPEAQLKAGEACVNDVRI